jgi:hypothetical protein
MATTLRTHVMQDCMHKKRLARLHRFQVKHDHSSDFERDLAPAKQIAHGQATGSSPRLWKVGAFQPHEKRPQAPIESVFNTFMDDNDAIRATHPDNNSADSKGSQNGPPLRYHSSPNIKFESTRRCSSSRARSPSLSSESSPILSIHTWRSSSPTTYLNGGADDPFSSACIPINHVSSGLINFYLHDMTRYFIPLAGTGGATVRAAKDEVIRALASEPVMFSLLSYISSTMRCRFPGALNPCSPESTGALMYGTKCIELLRHKLSSPPSQIMEATISAIIHIALAELVDGDLKRNLIHLQGAAELVRAKGGMHNLSPTAYAVIMTMDTICACLTTKVHFPEPYTVSDLDDVTKAEIAPYSRPDLMALGTSLLRDDAPFDQDLKNVFQELRELIYLIVHTSTHPGGMKEETQAWVVFRFVSIEHHLLLLTFPPGSDSNNVNPHEVLENSVRYATVLLACTTLSVVPLSRTRAAASHLQALLLQSSLETLWFPHAEILFWVLFIGLFIAETTELERWFLERLVHVAEVLGLVEWEGDEGAERVLQGFFYMADVHEEPFRRLWGMVGGKAGDACGRVRGG